MLSALQWSRQSVVSGILLGVLCGIGASILWMHGQNRESVFRVYSLLENGQSASGSTELIAGSFLPLPGAVDFFGEQEWYNADNLYEKINGKAPLYLEAGFTSLTTRRFMLRQDSALWFEVYIYDMGAPRNAFAVYSTQRRAGAAVISSLEPHDHYITENGLYLRHGAYYIECIGSAASDLLNRAMIAIGQGLLSADAGNGAAITELQLFPDRDLVPGSFKLILNNAFGSDALPDTFVAGYRLNGQLISAFISRKSDPEQAKLAARAYYRFLLESEGAPDAGIDSMHVVDLYGLLEIVFQVGPYVAGVHEAESRDEALEIAGRLRASLGRINEE